MRKEVVPVAEDIDLKDEFPSRKAFGTSWEPSACMRLTEPDAGSDAVGIQTLAEMDGLSRQSPVPGRQTL
jgi:hypothetical protein